MLKRNFTTEDLTYDLNSLTPGTRYSVQVFAVKCTRDLNPQEDTFYTTPNKVEDLQITSVTETSVFLNWTKPDGNLDFYLIKIKDGKQISSKTEGKEVRDLIPGHFYTFTVLSGVRDNSTWSEESIVSRNTKPGRVSDLSVSRNTHYSLQLNWKSPVGNVSFFRVVAIMDKKTLVRQNVTITEVNVTGLPIGSKITLSVTALVNGNIEGDSVTIDDYTAPGPIKGLNLSSTDVSLNASWNSEGDSSSFVVQLVLEGKVHERKTNFSEITFTGLKTAAQYQVIVYASNGHLEGEPSTKSIFTMPSPPTNAKSTYQDKSSITFEWDPPAKVGRVTYAVGIISSFWGHTVSERIENKTTHKFTGLKSGTKYDFQVQTVAAEHLSAAATVSKYTVADKREISLSMMCSSAEPLLCDENTSRVSVFEQLKKHFNEVLGENIFWKLEEVNPKEK
ncbi:fibronectin-like [Notothenia coriiceps]|uniref:Fibronectin-like n=1 Tax=Notothenia coriiceps TaxID=8208 RepID=A0A6I9N5P1_9TELE|nr:PREDICTED: fibronectin-like [Notothenia coriiceps]